MTTSDDVLETRKRLGWTQAQLAEALGVVERTVRHWESDRSTPPVYLKHALWNLLQEYGKPLKGVGIADRKHRRRSA